MNIKHFFIGLISIGILLNSSCKQEENTPSNKPTPSVVPPTQQGIHISGEPSSIDFTAKAESRELIVINADKSWKAELEQPVDWLSLSQDGTKLHLHVRENKATDLRSTQLILKDANSRREIIIRQIGGDPVILINHTALNVDSKGGDIDFSITTNVDAYELKLPSWITSKEARGIMRDIPLGFVVQANSEEATRTESIEVVESGVTGRTPVRASIAITQSGNTSQRDPKTGELADIKLRIVKGDASSTQVGNEIDKAFDNDKNTYYHSDLKNYDKVHDQDIPNYFPITLTFTLGQADPIDYLMYYPRPKGSENGLLKEAEIMYSSDGVNFELLERKQFPDGHDPVRISFEKTAGKAIKAIRFRVLSGHGENQGFAAIAELELYRTNPNKFDPLTLFTDKTCSALRPEITLSSIEACPEVFYRDLALALYHKRYESEFRIASYRAYPNTYRHLADNKMQFAYSLLDNPTGIAVEPNEVLTVFVGDTYGHQGLALRVVDYYQNGENDGLSSVQSYPLSEGLNKIKMSTPGLVYLYYIKPTIAEANTAQPIKVHIASGSVNGYYDTQRAEHKGRWRELLNKAKHPYFDLVGKQAHLAYPVKIYKEVTPSGDALAGLYDSIVLYTQEFHGLQRYNRTFNNRMLFAPSYRQGYMYATHEHTSFSASTLSHIANPQKLRDGVWGVAHEVGHMHQTVPALLWQGMTECTVNIPTLYIQTILLGRESRLQIQALSDGSGQNSYTAAFNDLIVGKVAHAKATSGTHQLVPFWQLQLYFGNVLGRSPHLQNDKGGFYPALYEYIRQHPSVTPRGDRLQDRSFNGRCLIEFTYMASLVSGYNLVDFFEKWGFLRPVEAYVHDYDHEWVVVTQEQIEEVRRRINSQNLRSLERIPLEYITDKNADLFKQARPIQVGKASRVGNEINFEGWRNVVAFEVLNAQGELIFVSDGTWTNGSNYRPEYYMHLSVRKGLSWQQGYKVFAVSATGERIPVNITEPKW